jgi:uncharacterized protein (TIGR03067 family)
LIGAAASLPSFRTEAAAQPETRREKEPAAKAPEKKEAKTESDKDKLQGTWVIVDLEQDGKKVEEKTAVGNMRIIFDGDQVKVVEADESGASEGSYRLNPEKSPKEMDMVLTQVGRDQKEDIRAIYRLEDDLLTLCAGDPGTRPTEFTTGGKTGKGKTLMTFKRSRADDAEKMQGSWKVVAGDLKGGRVLFLDDRILFEGDGGMEKGSFQIDPASSQAMILTLPSGKRKGDKLYLLYSLEGSELTLVLPRHVGWPGGTDAKHGLISLTLKRDRE